MLHLPANRYQAFAIHLGLSAVLFTLLAVLLYFYWFPGPFMQMGGWFGIKLIAGVDLVLGPLLTLIVYNRAKKSIKFDLLVIGLIQLGCLSAGIWTVSQERPLVQLLVDDKIKVYTASDLAAHKLDKNAIASQPGMYPKTLYVELPKDPVAREILAVTSQITKQRSLADREDLYRPLSDLDAGWLQDQVRDEKQDCYWLNISAVHFQGEGCLSLEKGLVSLKKS